MGEGPIERIDVIRTGVISSIEAKGVSDWSLERRIPRLAPGEYHYVRVVEHSGALAWSSPIYAD